MMWFLSGVGEVPTPNVRSYVWDRVESYTVCMLLTCRLKIITTCNRKLIISLFGITTSITMSLPVVIICALNLACSVNNLCLLEVGHQAILPWPMTLAPTNEAIRRENCAEKNLDTGKLTVAIWEVI
jgi:hypothetical protein